MFDVSSMVVISGQLWGHVDNEILFFFAKDTLITNFGINLCELPL